MRKKIAIINQRYGSEVNGGSEYYTKKLAEHLSEFYEIEVITTTALDYDTWKPYYPEGVQTVDGVRVRRFSVKKMRNIRYFKLIDKMMHMFPALWKVLEPIWIKEQGPYCPELIRYIRENKENFDTFIFVTYLYYTTVAGLPEAADKAVLVPTAHDERCIYFHTYRSLWKAPKAIAYLTEEEKLFVERISQNGRGRQMLVGSGIDVQRPDDSCKMKANYKIDDEYLIYVGRVDISKNCDVLFKYFIDFKRKYPSALKLLIVGKLMMEVPEREDIISLGFVEEEIKYAAMSGAKALLMPSEHESLSLVLLEAMSLGVPVIVNGNCQVLKGHCQKSNAGLWYKNEKEFCNCLLKLFNDRDWYHRSKLLCEEYVKENYDWGKTIQKYRMLIEDVYEDN